MTIAGEIRKEKGRDRESSFAVAHKTDQASERHFPKPSSIDTNPILFYLSTLDFTEAMIRGIVLTLDRYNLT